jgi:Na+-transporting methylmalonyl-CoA/oxaloacetate decarboxylase gamma subunit
MKKKSMGMFIVLLVAICSSAFGQGKFDGHDTHGISTSVIVMCVVFFALILLYIVFKIVGAKSSQRNVMEARGVIDKNGAEEKSIGSKSGECFAAIGMALYEYQSNVHDVEKTVLTISRVKRDYSPWNSKIYMLRQTPKR